MEDVWQPAFDLVPHRPPMLLVDEARLYHAEIKESSESYMGEVKSLVSSSWPVLTPEGALLEPAFFEIAAQAFAALAGLKMRSLKLDGEPRIGFLVSAKRFEVGGAAFVGDLLNIKVRIAAELGEFAVVESDIFCGDKRLAGGQLKIYAPTAEQIEAMLGADSADK